MLPISTLAANSMTLSGLQHVKPDKACNCFTPPDFSRLIVLTGKWQTGNHCLDKQIKNQGICAERKDRKKEKKQGCQHNMRFCGKTVCVSFFHLSLCINRA